MHTKQRIGQVSQVVIDAARYAEAVNRAGQLRMLSQRAVKLYALLCLQVRPAQMSALLKSSVALVDETLATLARSLSQPTFGDLLGGVAAGWAELKSILQEAPVAGRLMALDRLAEDTLTRSEQLTANLEVSGYATALHVINVAGRQRMLSQRLAKATLMATMLDGPIREAARASAAETAAALVDAMGYLVGLPLSNDEITREIAAASLLWDEYRLALERTETVAGLDGIAALSETLLDRFDRLTTQFERAMQAFVSPLAGPG